MHATDETYNGWKNRETWACHLWLTNDEQTYRMTQAVMRAARINDEPFDTAMRQHVEAMFELDVAPDGMRKDIGSLWRVDWHDVAAAFADDE